MNFAFGGMALGLDEEMKVGWTSSLGEMSSNVTCRRGGDGVSLWFETIEFCRQRLSAQPHLFRVGEYTPHAAQRCRPGSGLCFFNLPVASGVELHLRW